VRVLSVLAVNTQVSCAIIREPHVALWRKRLDTPAINLLGSSLFWATSWLLGLLWKRSLRTAYILLGWIM